MKPSAKQEGYKFIKYLGNSQAVFEEIETRKQELYFANKNHASWGFSYNNTDWEFIRDYIDFDSIVKAIFKEKNTHFTGKNIAS
jgi:catalase